MTKIGGRGEEKWLEACKYSFYNYEGLKSSLFDLIVDKIVAIKEFSHLFVMDHGGLFLKRRDL